MPKCEHKSNWSRVVSQLEDLLCGPLRISAHPALTPPRDVSLEEFCTL
jgi:hypothetical protein